MADLITTTQWVERTGRSLSASELMQVEALIVDASALVVDIVNDATVTDTWDAATPATVPASVVPVVVSMVRRGLDNPAGYTSESVGGYSYNGAAGTGVYATRSEAKVIRRAVGTSGVGSLNLDSYLHAYPYNSWLDGAL